MKSTFIILVSLFYGCTTTQPKGICGNSFDIKSETREGKVQIKNVQLYSLTDSINQISEFEDSCNKAPKLIVYAFPIYPEIARRASVEGEVIIKFHISKKGKVINSHVLFATYDLFLWPSIQIADSLRYSEYKVDCNAEEFISQVTIRYYLEERKQ